MVSIKAIPELQSVKSISLLGHLNFSPPPLLSFNILSFLPYDFISLFGVFGYTVLSTFKKKTRSKTKTGNKYTFQGYLL